MKIIISILLVLWFITSAIILMSFVGALMLWTLDCEKLWFNIPKQLIELYDC